MVSALRSQPGVAHIEADYAQKSAVCVYDAGQTSADDVVALIQKKSGRVFSVAADGPLA